MLKLRTLCSLFVVVGLVPLVTGCQATQNFSPQSGVSRDAGTGAIVRRDACSLGHITVFNGPAGGTGGVNIAPGLSGDLWYGDIGLNDIVKMTTSGLTKAYTIPSGGAYPEGIAMGPNKQMWFTEWTQPDIGAITAKGKFRLYSVGQFNGNASHSVAMVQGPDHRLWFTTGSLGVAAHKVGGATTLYTTGVDSEDLSGLGIGPDKNLWFVTFAGPHIGKVTTNGKVTTYDVGSYGGFGVAAGSDGRLWFPDPGNSRIGAVNTDGSGLTFYKSGLIGQPYNIVAAADGNLYFSTGTTATIGRITTKGAIKECAINAPQNFVALGITVGPDKNVWLLDNQHSQVARLTLP